jgi:small conductance mechanosensitive channel
VPLDAETRNYLYIWIRRFVLWAVFGYAVPEAAWWLGVPGAIYALMLNIAGLVIALLAIIFVLQNRAQIAKWIAGPPTASGWGRIRRSLAEIWPVLAVIYISAIYLIYALRIHGGFVYVARATTLSLIVIVAAQVVARFVRELSRRGFAISPDLKAQFPTLEQRANRYLPILTGLCAAVIYVLAALTVLQAWNIGAFAWLGSDLGRRIIGNALSIGLELFVALALWETFASAIERYLSRIDASGVPRRTRVRTLLPLLRAAMLTVLVILTSLIILSHIGVDITPLLAGAGVVGVAIGFGSQALVKDVITGLFILMEDQIAVGDGRSNHGPDDPVARSGRDGPHGTVQRGHVSQKSDAGFRLCRRASSHLLQRRHRSGGRDSAAGQRGADGRREPAVIDPRPVRLPGRRCSGYILGRAVGAHPHRRLEASCRRARL